MHTFVRNQRKNMKKVIPGSSDCSILVEIKQAIRESNQTHEISHEETFRRLLDEFSKVLNSETLESLVKVRPTRRFQIEALLECLIKKWALQNGKNATVRNLVDIFYNSGLDDLANRLKVGSSTIQHGSTCLLLPKGNSKTKLLDAAVQDEVHPTYTHVVGPAFSDHRIRKESSDDGYDSENNLMGRTRSLKVEANSDSPALSGFLKICLLQCTIIIVAVGILVYLQIGPMYPKILQLLEVPTQLQTLQHQMNRTKNLGSKTCDHLSYPVDYNSIKKTRNTSVDIYIYGQDAIAWPLDPPVSNAEHIYSITWNGSMSLSSIFTILRNAKNVETINFSISKARKMESKSEDSINILREFDELRPVALPFLRELRLQNFTRDKHIIKAFAEKVVTEGLREFSIIDTQINSDDITYISEIINNNRQYLKKLSLSNSQGASQIIQNNINKFPVLQELVIDFRDSFNNMIKIYNLPLDFHTRFEGLQVFRSKSGFIPMHLIHKLLRLKNLSTLDIGVLVPEELKTFNVNILQSAPSTLKFVKLDLWFQKKYKNDTCIIEREPIVGQSFELEVQSNC